MCLVVILESPHFCAWSGTKRFYGDATPISLEKSHKIIHSVFEKLIFSHTSGTILKLPKLSKYSRRFKGIDNYDLGPSGFLFSGS